MTDIRNLINKLEMLAESARPTRQLNEGGGMPGVGPIHISEIEPTLDELQKVLGIDLKNNTLGSVGKKEFSGDIDVALNIKPEDIPAFVDKLKTIPAIKDIAKSSVIMTKVKIADYDPNKQVPGKERTGYVQVDFMPGDPGWLKTFYHSPHEKDSKYKGVFRNILISTIAAFLDRKDSNEKIADGRPLKSERYMWSPTDGLIRVLRTPEPNKKGDGYTKKNNNKIVAGPYKNPDEIAKVLKMDSADDLYSYETLRKAMDKNYSPELVSAILSDFAKNSVVKDVGVPDDIKVTESKIGSSDWFRSMLLTLEAKQAVVNESRMLLEAARIQHAEDIIFWEGAAGAARAINSLRQLEKGGHKAVTVKWDGSPAVIFGRDENGNFVFTDKSGFTAKGYNGRATSGKELKNMFLNRSGGKNRDNPSYVQFANKMAQAFDVFARAVPEDYRGYFKGDLLYFSTPPVVDGHYAFKPNVVEYYVPVNSPLGKQIGASTAGVVIHRQIDEMGNEHPLTDGNVLQTGELLVVPPVTVEQPPMVDNRSINKLDSIVKSYGKDIDELLNTETLKAKKISDFASVLYTYVNSKVDTGLSNLGSDFEQWLSASKVSSGKQAKMLEHIAEHQKGWSALWNLVSGIMRVKDNIISQLDKQSTIKAKIGSQEGGEGYVLADPKGDIKLVNRSGFTAANRAVQR